MPSLVEQAYLVSKTQIHTRLLVILQCMRVFISLVSSLRCSITIDQNISIIIMITLDFCMSIERVSIFMASRADISIPVTLHLSIHAECAPTY